MVLSRYHIIFNKKNFIRKIKKYMEISVFILKNIIISLFYSFLLVSFLIIPISSLVSEILYTEDLIIISYLKIFLEFKYLDYVWVKLLLSILGSVLVVYLCSKIAKYLER
jgi:hypothetical protein